VVFCQTWLDRSWLWSAPREVVLSSACKLQGAVHELEGDVPTIIFAPHFYGMDAGGLALPLNTPRAFTSIFRRTPIRRWMPGSWRGASALAMCACSTVPMA
jgi:KDO2-lipid IV(A) lauroyltransferase